MQVAPQLVTIYGDPSVCPYTLGFSVNMSLTQFTGVDVVISSASVGKALPPSGQVILPARFWVITALEWVNPFTARFWVNTALKWVNPFAAHVWVVEFVDYAACVWVFEFVDHSRFMVPFAAHVSTFEHVNYCGAHEQLDETATPQDILSQALVN